MRGTWIEIVIHNHRNHRLSIALHTGNVNWNVNAGYHKGNWQDRSPWKKRELKFRCVLVCRIHTKIALHAGSVNWNSVLTLWNKLLYWSLPIRGAWIEILLLLLLAKSRALCRERELKLNAWILATAFSIAPMQGAWIEMKYFLRNYAFALRLLTPHKKWELKYHFFSIAEAATQSFPLWGTRIEILLRIIDLKDNNAAP